jgi:hypothetical protein
MLNNWCGWYTNVWPIVDLDRAVRASALVNLLRARTNPPYPSAYFEEDGRRTYVRARVHTSATPAWMAA